MAGLVDFFGRVWNGVEEGAQSVWNGTKRVFGDATAAVNNSLAPASAQAPSAAPLPPINAPAGGRRRRKTQKRKHSRRRHHSRK